MNKWKIVVPDTLAIVFLVAISVLYFLDPIREGLVLSGNDHSAGIGIGVEMQQYRDAHNGERTRWTNSLFCGMPTYQMSPSYPSTDRLAAFENVYKLGLPDVAAYVFMMLLGFYIMLRAFNFRVWMSALGAVLWAFSSYYFIIIQAGHIWKLLTLCFVPPVIGGMVLCYRGRYLWGMVLTGCFTALQIMSNHVQMSYYFLFVMGLMSLAYLADAVKNKTVGRWWRATACAAVGGILGVCVNLSNLYHTWEYSNESMRGKSELTGKTKDAADQTKSGLERSYITMWSYGIGETWTLLVPNTKGGASVPLAANETAMKLAKKDYAPIYRAFTQYWGEQPGTSGPVYVGAFVLTLFFLGLLVVRTPMKWALLVATVLSILLSWGKNFMWFTDLFLDYVPMYDKFRTVASILVIAEFTIPLLAMMALKRVVEDRSLLNTRNLGISFALTGGVAFLFWLMPDMFFGDYLSTSDAHYMQQYVQAGYIPQQLAADILANMNDMRRAMFSADAMRSLVVVVVGTLVMIVYRAGKIKTVPMLACLTVLCIGDMWGVDKRYLNDGHFVAPQTNAQAFPLTPADKIIKEDKDIYYRVLNLAVSTFNDNTTSYHHKSVGGYHPAKLRRYQELIEEHLYTEMKDIQKAATDHVGLLGECDGDSLFPVLNMLNTKYLLLGTKEGSMVPVANPWANGNAWFVDRIEWVDGADNEIAALHGADTKHTAIADTRFKAVLGDVSPADSTDTVRLTAYEANALTFEAQSSKGGVMVVSDIYYPGWTCTVDGKETEIARVNYVLRAIAVPAGSHVIEMRFDPQSVHSTETVANIAMALLALLVPVSVVVTVRKRLRKEK